MGESVSTWTPSCHGSIRVELHGQRTTSDRGALLLREALDSSGVIDALEDHLADPRDPQCVRNSLASQQRAMILKRCLSDSLGIELIVEYLAKGASQLTCCPIVDRHARKGSVALLS